MTVKEATMIELLYKLIACHFVGDYALQIDFIAKSKGSNLWHMIAHCVLYTVPFAIVFGTDWRIDVILAMHFIVDSFKARWHKIGYASDQILHLATLAIYLI